MLRVLLLALFGAVIFFGMAMPIMWPGWAGKLASVVTIVGGGAVVYWIEGVTRKSLDEDSAWNRVMTAENDGVEERRKDLL